MARWSEFLKDAMFTTRVVWLCHDCDLKDAMLPVLRGDVVYINISNLVKLLNVRRAICWPIALGSISTVLH
jgi:hypothetical protein